MRTDALQLLKMLEPAVRPAGAPAARLTPTAPIEQQSFGALLEQASAGLVESGRPVGVAPGAALEHELTPDELQSLGPAADRAEAAGATSVLMLMAGRGLVVDLPAREVTAELSGHDAGPRRGIDAAIFVSPQHDPEQERG